MAVIRALHNPENPYKRISSAVFNYGLSAKAIGVLCFLLNCSDRWEPNVNHLRTVFKDGKTAMQSALDELKAAGFLVRVAVRNKVGHIIDWRSVVHEEPINPAEIPNAGYYTTDIHGNYHKHARTIAPEAVHPDPDFPDLVNQAQTIKNTTTKKTTIKKKDPPLPPQGEEGEGDTLEVEDFEQEEMQDRPPLREESTNQAPLVENKLLGDEKFSAPRVETNSPVIEAEIVFSASQNDFWYNHPTLEDWEVLGSDPDWEDKLPKDPINQTRQIYPWYATFPKYSINLSVAHPDFNREFVGYYLKRAIAQGWKIIRNLSPEHALRAIIRCIKHKCCNPEDRADLMAAWIEMQEEKAKANGLATKTEVENKTVGQIAAELKSKSREQYFLEILEQCDRAKASAPKPEVVVSNFQPKETPKAPESEPIQVIVAVPIPDSIKAVTEKLEEKRRIKAVIDQVLGKRCFKLKTESLDGCCQLLNALIDKHQVPLTDIQEILNEFPKLGLEIYNGHVDLQF